MTLNCPINREMLCQECRHNSDNKCWWFFPARHLEEILTVEERLDMKPLPQAKWAAKQWDKVQQLQSEVTGWREKHAKIMLAYEKAFPKKKKSKYD